MLRTGQYFLIPSDKTHSFVAVSVADYITVVKQCLDNQCVYERVEDDALVDPRLLAPLYTTLARRCQEGQTAS